MKKVKVKIVGVSPLLINRFKMEKEEGRKDKQYVPEEEAQEKSYFDAKLGYYVPSSQIEACLREAAKNFKQKKSNYKATILSSVFVEETKISLGRKYVEVDQQFARVQRQGIVRSRPIWNRWELEFTIQFDELRITADKLQEILIEGGGVKAIGDYRPKYGRFKVEKFEAA